MGELPDAADTDAASSLLVRRKRPIGGPMNMEEMKLNKAMLNEIANLKRKEKLSVDAS